MNPNSASADVSTEDNNNTKEHYPTYADKTANQPAAKKTPKYCQEKPKQEIGTCTSQNLVCEAGQSPDGFKGVQRKHGKTKKSFVTGIAEGVI